MSVGKQVKFENLRDLVVYLTQIQNDQFTLINQQIQNQLLSTDDVGQRVAAHKALEQIDKQHKMLSAFLFRVIDPTFAGLNIDDAMVKLEQMQKEAAEAIKPEEMESE